MFKIISFLIIISSLYATDYVEIYKEKGIVEVERLLKLEVVKQQNEALLRNDVVKPTNTPTQKVVSQPAVEPNIKNEVVESSNVQKPTNEGNVFTNLFKEKNVETPKVEVAKEQIPVPEQPPVSVQTKDETVVAEVKKTTPQPSFNVGNMDVSYGYLSTIDYVLVANKNKKLLKVFKKTGNDFDKIFEGSVLVGKNKGDKQFEGDLKTPTGAYIFKHLRTDMGSFYGPLAFVTDYPNLYDQLNKKDGYGIWVHGLPMDPKVKRDSFTQGCIALDNSKLTNLRNLIDYQKAVILIDENDFQKATTTEINQIFSFIEGWKQSWIDSDINAYLDYYSGHFRRLDGTSLDSFKAYKKRIFAKNEDKKITFSNIDIYPYPNSEKRRMFRVIMDEDYWSTNYKFDGKKELFLEIKNNEVTILAEG